MVKLIACLKRKPGISVEAFQRHWSTQHAEIVVRQKGLRRYVQNHALQGSDANGEPPFDGVAEAWFDDVDTMRRLAPTPEYRAVRDDEPHFLDVSAMRVVLADEFVAVDGKEAADAVKAIVLLTRKPELAPEAFQRHWREVYAPLVARLPQLRRYVQSHARLGGYASGRAPAYDGIGCTWFDDDDALAEASASPEMERVAAGAPSFLARGPAPVVLARGLEIAL